MGRRETEMRSFWNKNQWRGVIFPGICLLLSGCGSFFPAASASPSQPYAQLVHQTAVASFLCDGEIISIASGGFFNADFIGQSGEKRNETLSQLFISMRDKPEASRMVYAYGGMTFYYYTYRIQIIRLGRDLQNPFTEVRMEFANEKESSAGSPYCVFY